MLSLGKQTKIKQRFRVKADVHVRSNLNIQKHTRQHYDNPDSAV